MATRSVPPPRYPELLATVIEEIRSARLRAAVAVNSELAELYCRIGPQDNARRAAEGWGAKVVERLADNLKREFPGAKGFSKRNLEYAARFAAAWLRRELADLPRNRNTRLRPSVREPLAVSPVEQWNSTEHGARRVGQRRPFCENSVQAPSVWPVGLRQPDVDAA